MDRELAQSIDLTELLDRLPSGIVLTDQTGCIHYVNQAFTQITGYSLEDCLGHTPRILKSGQHSDEEYNVLWKTIASGREFRGRLINKKKNGSLYWEYIQISPLRDRSGQGRWFLAVIEDITGLQSAAVQDASGKEVSDRVSGNGQASEEESGAEQRRLERLILTEKRMLAQLEKLLTSEQNVNTMRADLINVLSHEFRTPLSVIQSSADLLKSYRSQMDNETVDRRLEKIASMVFSMTALLDDALGIWQKGDQSKPRSASDVIREVLEMRFDGATRDVRLAVDSSATNALISGAHHLRNLMLAVLESSDRFSPPGTPILVQLTAGPGRMDVAVSDASLQDNRAETLDSVVPGSATHLDLAIVQRALKKLGGTFRLERTERGTTVHLALTSL